MASNSFDLIRLFAALLVVYGHAFPLTTQVGPAFAGNSVQANGVKIFSVISGYLIMGSWARDPSPWRFALRRCLRIVPGLTVVVLLTVLVLGPLVSVLPVQEYFSNSRTWTYLSNILFRPQYDLPGVFGANPYPGAVNGSLWSLPAEMAMYVIGPMVFMLGRAGRFERWTVLAAALVLSASSIWFLRLAPPQTVPVLYGSSLLSFLDVAPYFLIGAVYAGFKLERYLSVGAAGTAWIVMTLVGLPGWGAEVALYFVLPYAALALGLAPSSWGKRVSAYGDISYGLYLYGFPLQQCVIWLLPATQANPWVNVACTLVPLVLLATLSWRWVEQPLLRFKPARVQRPSKNSHVHLTDS